MLIIKYIAILVGAILLLRIILALYQPYNLVKLIQYIFPSLVFYMPTKYKQKFALTFDDGPNPPYTDEILNILNLYDVKATFFVVGEKIQSHPEYINKIVDNGHQIANHLYTHNAAIFMSNAAFNSSLNKTEEIINQNGSPRYFRPTYGWIRPSTLELARRYDYQAVLGSAYVSDPYPTPKWLMLVSLKKMLRPGIIMVLHDGGGNREKTVNVLSNLLKYARTKNMVSVTLHNLSIVKDN